MPKERHPDIFMPWFIMDYQKDTMHLTLEEDGLYRRMLDMHWLTRGRGLPDDDLRLANTLRVDMPTWLRLKPVMMPFFQIANGVWLNRRNYAEYVGRVAAMESASERSQAGVEARRRKAQTQAEVEPQVEPQVVPEVEPQVEPEQYQSESHSHSNSESFSDPKPESKAIDNVVSNALEGGDLEECMRRTRELVGEKEMAGRKYGFWKTLYLDCTPAYRDSLTDAESRKKEAARGLPEAQIKKTWAHYLTFQFKEFKKAYAN